MAHPDGPIRQAPIEQIIPSQSALWNEQHAQRGVSGLEGTSLLHTPNESARVFRSHLPPPPAIVFEIGPGHGRDARWLATQGYTTHAVDFSQVALDQLTLLAEQQGISNSIIPILHDISKGTLPPHIDNTLYSGFYARSSLHVDDATLYRLTSSLNNQLLSGAAIMIEGKAEDDPKIRRSVMAGCNLAMDMQEKGHLRRIWTPECMADLADVHGWRVHGIEQHIEQIGAAEPSVFLRLTARKI